jgi:hypothetical protein
MLTDDEVKQQIQDEVGIKPEFAWRLSPTWKVRAPLYCAYPA